MADLGWAAQAAVGSELVLHTGSSSSLHQQASQGRFSPMVITLAQIGR